MRYRLLAIVVLSVALHVAFAVLAPSPGAAAEIHFAFRVAMRALATWGCLLAGLRFARGDYLRRGWMLFALSFGLLLAKDLWRGPSLHGLASTSVDHDAVRDALVIAANAVGVAAIWVLARAWFRAGLALMTSVKRQVTSFVVAAAVSLAVTGPTLFTDVHLFLGGNVDALALVTSDVADVTSFALLGPLLLTAIALRGGVLAWTWYLLALGGLSFLFMDVAQSLGAFGHGSPRARLAEEVFRTAAAAAYLGAGLAQRWALESARGTRPRRALASEPAN